MKIKVVCFDIDGTLYPKWVTDLKLVRSFFPSPLLAIRYQRFRRHIREEGVQETVPANEQGFRLRQANWMAQQNRDRETGGAVERMAEKIESQFYSSWKKSFSRLPAYPQVRETFEFLRSKGLRIAVLSDFPLEAKLAALHVDDLVDFAVCAEASGYLKPHVAPFQLVCDSMNITPPEVLYVGDSCHKDMFGASRVGMGTALIAPHATTERKKKMRQKECTYADFIFSNYNEFMEHLKHMLQ